jgi:predicted secreted Zn-dependent protease
VHVAAACYFYLVSGSTALVLRRSLDTDGPIVLGSRFDAWSSWHVSWDFALAADTTGRCEATGVSASLSVTVTFPQWTDPSNGAPDLQDRWYGFLDALATHETGHEAIAIQAANAAVQAIESLDSFDSCSAAETRSNAAGQHELDVARAAEADYDDATKHGETQGATFP